VSAAGTARRVARVFVVLAGWVTGVAWLTWPLAANIASALPTTAEPCRFDQLTSIWAMAWTSRALWHDPSAIAQANIYHYHPTPDALFYGPTGFGALPFFAPVFLATGNPALAANAVVLLGLASTAASVHLVVYAWTGLHAAGLVGGATILTSRWLLWWFGPTTPQHVVLPWLPLVVYLAAARVRSRRSTFLLGAAATLQGLSDPVYVAPAVLAPLALLGLGRALRRATRRDGAALLATVAAAALVLFLLHAPFLRVARANPHLARQSQWHHESPTPFVFPDDLFSRRSTTAVPLAVLALIAVGFAVRTPRDPRTAWTHATFWTLAGVAMSLPHTVAVGGTTYRLPHHELLRALVPGVAALRVPERLGVATLIGLALLAGLACAALLRRLGLGDGVAPARRLAGGALAAAIAATMYGQYAQAVAQPHRYGAALPSAYPLRPAFDGRASPVLELLRHADGAVVEVPIPPMAPTAAALHAMAMYRSIFHRRPVLNGYSSYWPAGWRDRAVQMTRLPDPVALAALRRDTGLAWILVRPPDDSGPLAMLTRDAHAAWHALAASGGRPDLVPVADDGELLLFRVVAPDGARG
jgi:hypothetical protein